MRWTTWAAVETKPQSVSLFWCMPPVCEAGGRKAPTAAAGRERKRPLTKLTVTPVFERRCPLSSRTRVCHQLCTLETSKAVKWFPHYRTGALKGNHKMPHIIICYLWTPPTPPTCNFHRHTVILEMSKNDFGLFNEDYQLQFFIIDTVVECSAQLFGCDCVTKK